MNYYQKDDGYMRDPKVPNKIPNPHEPWPKIAEKEKWQKEQAKPITIADLFPNLGRLSIGWSPVLSELKEIVATKPSYPPYDIIKANPHSTVLQVAVAGFSKEDLKVTIEDQTLVITGNRNSKTVQEGEVLYQGIAGRDFTLKLAIAEYWVLSTATLKDGMLEVIFNKEIPEEKKPKVIDIK